jgi:hypothetical protein
MFYRFSDISKQVLQVRFSDKAILIEKYLVQGFW